jgi:hypothetical protein
MRHTMVQWRGTVECVIALEEVLIAVAGDWRVMCMPLVRIDMIEGRDSAAVKGLLDASHRALVAAFTIPLRDRYQPVPVCFGAPGNRVRDLSGPFIGLICGAGLHPMAWRLAARSDTTTSMTY